METGLVQSTRKTTASRPQSEKAGGHARFVDYAQVALDSPRANKLRSFLTLLGIIIGITSIIAVICVIQGLDHYWKEKVANFAPNTFVVTQFPIETNPDRFYEMLRRNTEIHADDADEIARHCPACQGIGVECHKEVTVKYQGQTLEQVDLSGITPNILEIEPYDFEAGRVLMSWENDHSQDVAFVGYGIMDKLLPGRDPIDKSVQIDGRW